VRDTVTGRHEIQLTRSDELLRTEAVAMQELSTEKPRHGLQAHVWMRRDVDGSVRAQRHRPHVIDETPRAYGPSTLCRQGSTYAKFGHLRFAALKDLDPVVRHDPTLLFSSFVHRNVNSR
jgi:hypothetical protein